MQKNFEKNLPLKSGSADDELVKSHIWRHVKNWKYL